MQEQNREVDYLKQNDEEKIVNLSLRPRTLDEFIGQERIISSLKVTVAAAKKRNEGLEHILIAGPAGLGKTSIAYCIAREMNAKVTATSGPAIERAGDLVGILTNLEKGDVLFIDEIHRLSKVVEEFLYPAIEDFKIDFLIDKGPYAKSVKFSLKPFTLIGATTRKGLLSSPLRSRFGLFYDFDFYELKDLALIVERNAERLEIEIDQESCYEIARCSRGTPRLANRLLRRVRDFAQVKANGFINFTITKDALSEIQIDQQGLDRMDRKYLENIILLHGGGPVGIEAIAASLGEDKVTLEDVIEPYLLKKGFVVRSPRGRIATDIAYQHLSISCPKKEQEQLF